MGSQEGWRAGRPRIRRAGSRERAGIGSVCFSVGATRGREPNSRSTGREDEREERFRVQSPVAGRRAQTATLALPCDFAAQSGHCLLLRSAPRRASRCAQAQAAVVDGRGQRCAGCAIDVARFIYLLPARSERGRSGLQILRSWHPSTILRSVIDSIDPQITLRSDPR